MPLKSSLLLILVLGLSAPLSAQEVYDTLVTVTSKHGRTKKASQHGYRLQISIRGDKATVSAIHVSRFTKTLKSLRFPSGKIRRSALEQNVASSLDSTFALVNLLRQQLSYQPPSEKEYRIQRDMLLAGKHSSSYLQNQWIELGSFPATIHSLSFQTRGFFRTHHEYVSDQLPGGVAWELPALDPWNCEPGEFQFLKFKKLHGYGIDKVRSDPYVSHSRTIIREVFEVYFPHNEYTPDQNGVRSVVDYLERNNYVILHAELTGGCSIEGNAGRNLFLQKRRANVLEKVLRQYNDELIERDTIILTDVTSQFRELIRNDRAFRGLDSLDDVSLQNVVNSNEDLRKRLEPILMLQRKATLKLTMAKRLSRHEQLANVQNDLQKASTIFAGAKIPTVESERKVMGIIDRLYGDYEKGSITKTELLAIINETGYADHLNLLIGYHLLKKYQDKTWPQSILWHTYWQKFEVDKWLEKARESLITLLQSTSVKEKRARYVRMLSDFQHYHFQFVTIGLIETRSLCQIPYPETPEFLPLTLSQYAFLYEVASSKPVTCLPRQIVFLRRDSVTDTDAFLETITEKYQHQSFIFAEGKLLKKKTFDTSPKGAYYYLLKQHYIKKNAAALAQVSYQNNNSPVVFNEFNLWHLLHDNVAFWNPLENHFYDAEVQLDELEMLIGLLKKTDEKLCKPQINQLYLAYHLKALHYLSLYPEPGNPKHGRIAENALKYICNYYKSRARQVNSNLAMHLVYQFNHLNWLGGPAPGAWYGYDLLSAVARTRELSGAELKMFAHYLKLFNPEMKRLPANARNVDELTRLSNEFYSPPLSN